MKWMRLAGVMMTIVALTWISGCSSSNPTPATIDGKWTYTTSDGKIKVVFELTTTTSGSVEIKNPATITVNGTSGNAVALVSGVNMPTIATISLNANDAALTYPHSITFSGCKFVNSSNKIDVTSGSYIIYSAGSSGGTTTNFSVVSITRP